MPLVLSVHWGIIQELCAIDVALRSVGKGLHAITRMKWKALISVIIWWSRTLLSERAEFIGKITPFVLFCFYLQDQRRALSSGNIPAAGALLCRTQCCFVDFKRFCCTDVISLSHQRRVMRHAEGMMAVVRLWWSVSCTFLLEGYPKQKWLFCHVFFCMQ